MSERYDVITVYELDKSMPVATIALNGYDIAAGSVFGRAGAMRSFKVINGEVWRYWEAQTPLRAEDSYGNEQRIRIFAVPAQTDALGFVEFLA